MITTGKFVLVHMHKTGGQSLGRLVGECVPGMQQVGYHYPHHMLPKEYGNLPLVGMVRNPWDWYISWYAFNTRQDVGNPLFFILSDGFQADYRKTIGNLVRLCSKDSASQAYREALIEILPDGLEGNAGVGLTRDCIRGMADYPDLGYYSWQFRRRHGDLDNPRLRIGRFENLQGDFIDIMRELEVDQADAIEARFEDMPRINASRHSHYSKYIDDELRDLIAERDAPIVERYGYRFEADESGAAPIEFPNIQIGYRNDSFRKLNGEARNFSLLKCHRVHIPIITNDKVVFTIGGEQKVLGEGEMWEINNATLHAVDNNSDLDRIRLIVDWVPNSTVRPEDRRPPPPKKAAAPRPASIPGYNGRNIGRNEPCPCNSSKKFKQCHGAPR